MFAGKSFTFEKESGEKNDGQGSKIKSWITSFTLSDGYLDMLSGSNRNFTEQNAVVQDSTHVLVFLKYYPQITDDLRVVGPDNSIYAITYVDNPVSVDHHSEVYLKRLVKG